MRHEGYILSRTNTQRMVLHGIIHSQHNTEKDTLLKATAHSVIILEIVSIQVEIQTQLAVIHLVRQNIFGMVRNAYVKEE